MAAKTTRLGFDDLIAKVRTKSISKNVWFVILNLKDAVLLLWRETEADLVSLGILLTTISSNLTKLEREAIKGALNAGVFGVFPKAAVHYLSHPKVATKVPAPAAAVVCFESDEDDEEVAEDIRQSKQHEADRWAGAKKPAAKDKGKSIVLSQQKKKLVVPSQTPREKLLRASINVEKARQNRESFSEVLKRGSKVEDKKRKRDSFMPTPPPKVMTPPAKEESSSSEEESDSFERERRAAETSDNDDSSDSSPPTLPVTKKGARLKMLKQMDKSHIDKEKKTFGEKLLNVVVLAPCRSLFLSSSS
ncbi:hypothetical protein R1sor_007594 [Riccia sorocarpa]|uniref:Uncharacterized protein n=1 Tax=Riccia sorocarpa TaxID=122646 RepID=A0ABD3HR91_9MARC